MSENDIKLAYGMSKMSVFNELIHNDNYNRMKFVEFLEFLGRVAHMKYKGTELTLTEKLEQLLDDIFFAYGLERNEVTIEVQEVSESDNDYWIQGGMLLNGCNFWKNSFTDTPQGVSVKKFHFFYNHWEKGARIQYIIISIS